MVRNVLAFFSRRLGLKNFEPSEKIPILSGREQ